MQWFREAIGVAKPQPPPKKPNAAVERRMGRQPEESTEVTLQRTVLADEHKLKALNEEIEDLRADSKRLVQAIRDPNCPPNMRAEYSEQTKMVLRTAQERTVARDNLAKKLHNTRGQLAVMQTANSNLDHAILIKQGADELEALAEATEAIGVKDNVDRLRDAADTVHEHTSLFTEDMGLSGNPMAGDAQDYLIDEELESLLRAQHDEDMDALLTEMHDPKLTAPTGAVASGQPRPPNTPPQVAVDPKTEN